MGASRQIAWETLGPADAPWFVISHGMGLSRDDMRPIAERLSTHWQILLWDMPGHGDSGSLPSSPSAWSMASSLETILRDLKVKNPVMLGFSFGGIVTQIVHRRDPDFVRGLILYGCYSPFLGQPLVPRQLVDPLLFVTMAWRNWPSLRDRFVQNCGIKERTRQKITPQTDRLGKAGMIAMARALLCAVAPDPAYRISCPLLLLRGDQDSNGMRLAAAQDALLQCADDAMLVLVADAGHCAHHDSQNAFENAVEQWLTAKFPKGA